MFNEVNYTKLLEKDHGKHENLYQEKKISIITSYTQDIRNTLQSTDQNITPSILEKYLKGFRSPSKKEKFIHHAQGNSLFEDALSMILQTNITRV